MGSFSFLKADNLTKIANIAYKEPFKFLIPNKYGGGYVKNNYANYGEIKITIDGVEHVYDMFEILAVWNYKVLEKLGKVVLLSKKDGVINFFPEESENTQHNRCLGIDLENSSAYFEPYIFPLKLVSCSYKGTYEECESLSISDPEQGFCKLTREKLRKYYPDRTYEKVVERVKRNRKAYFDYFNSLPKHMQRDVEFEIVIPDTSPEPDITDKTATDKTITKQTIPSKIIDPLDELLNNLKQEREEFNKKLEEKNKKIDELLDKIDRLLRE